MKWQCWSNVLLLIISIHPPFQLISSFPSFLFFFPLVTLQHMLWTYAKMLILKSCLHSSWAVIKSFVCFVGKLHSTESMSSCTGNQTILTNSVAFIGSERRDGLAHAECRDQNTFCLSTEAVIQTWLLILNQKILEMCACCELLCMLDRYSSITDDSFWSIRSYVYFIKVIFRSCIILALHLF